MVGFSEAVRKRAALVLIAAVLGIATAITRWPVDAGLPAAPGAPVRRAAPAFVFAPVFPSQPAAAPRRFAAAPRAARTLRAQPIDEVMAAAGPAPVPALPTTISEPHIPVNAPLIASHRIVTLDAPPPASSDALSDATEAAHAGHGGPVTRAFVTAGRQIAGAFKITGIAIKSAF